MRRLCVFAGARPGNDPQLLRGAAQLGAALARRGIGLVYGAGSSGMMGALANAALHEGGHVIGVIPRSMVEREWAHPGLSELRIVADMHERKALMNQLCDAFVALPGGIGTLEELFEVYTWAQLGFHHKPVAVLDVAGALAPLFVLLDHLVDQGFVGRETRGLLLHEHSIEGLLERLAPQLDSTPR